MEEKVINLTNKDKDETFRTYYDIAKEMEVQNVIWENTKNLETAKKVYTKYLEKQKKENN